MEENYIEQGFSGISKAFDTSFEMEEKDAKDLINQAEKQIEMIEKKRKELMIDEKELTLKDQTYIEEEIKSLINSSRCMLAKLESEIKIGSKSSYYDSYAKLSSSINNQIENLLKLNIAIAQTEIEKRKLGRDINNSKRATLILDANTLIDLVSKAREGSELNKIDANFTIEENDEEK